MIYQYNGFSVLVSDEDYKTLTGLDESIKRAKHGVEIYENDPDFEKYKEQLLSFLWQKRISKIKYNSELKKIPNRITFIQSNYGSFKNIISRNEEEKELILNKYKKDSFLYWDFGLVSRFRVSYNDLLRLKEIEKEIEKSCGSNNEAFEIAVLSDEKQKIYKKLLPKAKSLHHYDAVNKEFNAWSLLLFLPIALFSFVLVILLFLGL